MERNDTFRNLLIAATVFCGLWVLGEKFMPAPRPIEPRASDRMPGDETPAGTQPARSSADGAKTVGSLSPSVAGAAPPPAQSANGGVTFSEAADEIVLALGSAADVGAGNSGKKNPYRMRLTMSNIGASVESATMTDHAKNLGTPERFPLLSKIGDEGRGWFRSFAIEAINVDGTLLNMRDRRWTVVGDGVSSCMARSGEQGQGVTYQLFINIDGSEALRLTRSYCLPAQDSKLGRHDLDAHLTVENVSSAPHRVVLTYGGGLGVPKVDSFQDDRVFDVGVLAPDGRVAGAREAMGAVFSSLPGGLPLFEPAQGSSFTWAASGNKYFTCTLAPLSFAGGEKPEYVSAVTAVDLDGSAATVDDASIRFVTRPETFAVGQSLSYVTEIYLGHKDGDAFASVEQYRTRNYAYQITKGFGFCTFTWLVELMIWLLNTIYWVIPNYGVAIIFMVCIVRLLLHPITKKGQVNMVRMQSRMGELGPKMEEIKKRHAGDKARLQQETMALYRDSGINPATQMLGCLPMVIQMPIWVALYISLSNNIDMRHEPFFWWIRDLTSPDALYTFAAPLTVPIIGAQLQSFNLLPILMAVAMYLQQKLQPKPKPNPNASEQQRQQQEMMQKMMPLMSIMMLFFFYKMPSGLTLYIFASSLFGTIEQYRIRKHIKEQEEGGTLHKPVKPKPGPNDPKSQRALPGWVARLQKKVEDAQKIQKSQRAKPPRR